ncbi:CHAD domain-containing protein [Bradyrhizobium sp. AUGA SZCCT0169]|uniref:CYTH and CHAD domain-containing protein n=1 Tax=Bradyrhizobium sp. AUGA SZCCT0169 TaxID=2807663 RepID=UPI001BAA7E36|nr:CYTH and CHAD domain-containing protein [Bradyrhizobium sp. AUGA SZCCT0169]MBR1251019.1 CHAD domain-containing protein [Bradyrhizobium sp. AUGA SZCCT0169]
MSVEAELKFRVAPRKLSSVAKTRLTGARRGGRSEQNLVTIYFDTAKHKLKRNGLTLRVRQAGDDYVQTVKAVTSGVLARGEWETKLDGATPDLTKAKDTPLDRLITRKLQRKLKPVFRTSVRRMALPIRTRRSEIELAVDRGKIASGGRSRPISEFELELKGGSSADLFRIARSFERKTGAELDLQSKSEKGYQLAGGGRESASHAEPIHLDRKLSANDAFTAIASSTFRHFAANADAIRNLDAEAIHQMRVGLRRTRAAISLFDDVLPRASTAGIKEELKWLTGQLARAREIDVFLEERVCPVVKAGPPKRGSRAIEKKFAAQRTKAFKRAGQAVGSPRFRRLLIDMLEWIETRKAPADKDRSIGPYAAELLDRRIRKVRKQGKRLDELSPDQRHKLRIRIKKIRCALDFFEGLYDDSDRKEIAQLSSRLKNVQSALGALNDFMAHRKMATEAALTAPQANRRAQAFASGFLVGQEREAAIGLLKAARRELQHLRPLTVEPLR